MIRIQKPVALCICFAALFLTGTPATADNVILNPGFESGSLSPWFQGHDLTGIEDWNVTSADAHSGTFSATDVGNTEIRQNFVPVATDAITEASFWAKHPDSRDRILAYDFFYTDGTDDEFLVFTSDTRWDFFNVTANLVPGKMLDGFSIFGITRGRSTLGRTYFDDVIINADPAVPEPGSIALLFGMGLTGAGFLMTRRRR